MEKMEATLREWLAMDPVMVARAEIKTNDGLQPRAEELVNIRRRGRMEDASKEHVARMRGVLEARRGAQLEPLLVARINGELFVADGHHRLRAYKLAKRKTVPARVRELTYQEAVMVSKLVNLGGAKLPLDVEQARDAAWQYLAEVTIQGSLQLPLGESTRTVGARFGISHDTVAKMLKRLPEVDRYEYGPTSRDPGTEWPRWRYVKANSKWKEDPRLPPDWRRNRRAEKVAVSLFKKLDQWGPEVFWLGVSKFLKANKEGVGQELKGLLGGTEGADEGEF